MSDAWIEVGGAGYLKKFGRHKFFVSSPAEAIKALFLQVKGFEEAFLASKKKGLKFRITTDKRDINNLEHLYMGKPKKVTLVPTYAGNKSNNGLGQIFAAVAIAAVTYFTAGAGAALTGGIFASSTAAGIGYSLSLSLALGGISQMLAPQQSGLKTREDADNKASYAFGGPVNTAAQGTPVPLFYGLDREVGGAVVSASITAEDQA